MSWPPCRESRFAQNRPFQYPMRSHRRLGQYAGSDCQKLIVFFHRDLWVNDHAWKPPSRPVPTQTNPKFHRLLPICSVPDRCATAHRFRAADRLLSARARRILDVVSLASRNLCRQNGWFDWRAYRQPASTRRNRSPTSIQLCCGPIMRYRHLPEPRASRGSQSPILAMARTAFLRSLLGPWDHIEEYRHVGGLRPMARTVHDSRR